MSRRQNTTKTKPNVLNTPTFNGNTHSSHFCFSVPWGSASRSRQCGIVTLSYDCKFFKKIRRFLTVLHQIFANLTYYIAYLFAKSLNSHQLSLIFYVFQL